MKMRQAGAGGGNSGAESANAVVASGRYTLLSVVTGGLNLLFAVILFAVEVWPWSFWFGLQMLCISALCFCVFVKKWLGVRRYGDLLGLAAATTLGNLIPSVLLFSKTYYANEYQAKTPLMPICHVIFGLLLLKLMQMHKRDVVQADGDHADNPAIFDQEEGADAETDYRRTLFCRTLAPLATVAFGFASSRLGTGMVPAGHSVEALFGIVTACLMLGMYYKSFRQSAWGTLTCTVWTALVLLQFIAASILYAARRSSRAEKLRFGFSWLSCLVIASCWGVAFYFQARGLNEPLNWNFSKTPIPDSRSFAVVVSPTRGGAAAGGSGAAVDPETFGMTREEAEATARKLGLGIGARSPHASPSRDFTGITDFSDGPEAPHAGASPTVMSRPEGEA